MARNLTRDETVHLLKSFIGRIDDDGNEIVDPDEVTDPALLASARRPSRERIREIARQMAEAAEERERLGLPKPFGD